jgi:acetyl-CoA carboxylase biotin carboxyl carrier protein
MDIKEIKSVIDLMSRNGLSEFELEKPEFKIRVKKGANGEYAPLVVSAPAAPVAVPAPIAPAMTAPAPVAAPAAAAAAPAVPVQDANVTQIVSPMVGTFYTSPSPDSDPYVKIGQEVTPETVVCIIEAMKVMNEIKAEVKGTIIEVLAQNGKPVEFGKPLFAVRQG